MIGKIVGKYRILEQLGRGGMGTVYKAVDQTLGREVAIKVLNPGMAGSDVLKAFEAEAKTIAALNHPEIAAIHEIQRTGADLLIVTELVVGETLDQLLQRSGMLPPERAAYLVARVLGALAQAHAAGVVHRDLKPSNVMVTEVGGLKILDFAVARIAGAEQMTAVSSLAGTPAYTSPERILGNEIDGRADVYSVGVLFYRLLTDTLPFQAASLTELVEKQLSEAPTPARRYRPDLPEWCEEVLSRALAKAPADRFQTAEAFRFALLGAIGSVSDEQTSAHRAMPPESALAPRTPTAVTAMPVVLPAAVREVEAVAGAALVETSMDVTMGRALPTGAMASVVAPGELAAAVVMPLGYDDAPTMLARATSEAPATSSGVVWSSADAPTQSGSAPTAPAAEEPAGFAATVLAATASMPAASAPTGTTLVMKRQQFAVAAALLGTLALGVVLLAVIVITRSATVVVAPSDPAEVPQPLPSASPGAPPPAVEPAAPPPLEILDPPIRTTPSDAPPPPPLAEPRLTARREAPPVVSAPVATPSRVTNAAPFEFDAKAVVADGDKHRERDATVLIADGAVTVSQEDKVLYAVPVAALVDLTYSSSKQPLWNSPGGPAEAMKVESGAFGFLKGGSNWLGLRTSANLLVLRVDDDEVKRVIAGLQDRTGLPVARLIEPKE